MTLRKGVYLWEKLKISGKFQHLFKADHSRPFIVPLRVSPPFANCLCSWLVGLTLRTYTCNNVQLWRCRPTNERKIKSANYLHLDCSHSGHVSNFLKKKKTKEKC